MLTPLPDASLHNPDPGYFRRLLRACNLTYAEAAEMLQRDERTICRYASGEAQFDYPIQFTLEWYASRLAELLAKESDKMSCSEPEKSGSLAHNSAE